MFNQIIIAGLKYGKSNSEIIADIEKIWQTKLSDTMKKFVLDDIDWFRGWQAYGILPE